MVVAGTGGFVLAWSGSVLVVHVEVALVHVRSWSGVVVVGYEACGRGRASWSGVVFVEVD